MGSNCNKFVRQSESIGLMRLWKNLSLEKLVELEKSQLDHSEPLVISVHLMHFSFTFFDEFIWWPTPLGILEFGNVCALNVEIIVFGFTMSAEGRIWGIFFAAPASILFGEVVGLGIGGKVGLWLEGFSHCGEMFGIEWKKFIKEKLNESIYNRFEFER